eukprot:COSAG01_NODE_824_length_13299_cov_22.451364_13_plen_110_part_00
MSVIKSARPKKRGEAVQGGARWWMRKALSVCLLVRGSGGLEVTATAKDPVRLGVTGRSHPVAMATQKKLKGRRAGGAVEAVPLGVESVAAASPEIETDAERGAGVAVQR